jgi:hypothetical protein
MRVVVRTRLPRAQVRAAIRRLPAILAGKASDPEGVARAVQLRCSMVALSIIKDAFVVKARGGTDEAGESWKPLAESTIESRLRKKGVSRARAIKQAKEAYATLARTGRGLKKLERAKKTLTKTFADAASIEILRDDGILLNSLSPTVGSVVNPQTVVRHEGGKVAVGTNVPYAYFHQYGTKRMPARPPIPDADRWPDQWTGQIGVSAVRGLARALELAFGAGRSV